MSTQVETGTRQDVERIAREIMGWRKWGPHGDGYVLTIHPDGGFSLYPPNDNPNSWNPFTDANADVQVLERVRETWNGPENDTPHRRHPRWSMFLEALQDAWDERAAGYANHVERPGFYAVGDYARAAPHVLNTENTG